MEQSIKSKSLTGLALLTAGSAGCDKFDLIVNNSGVAGGTSSFFAGNIKNSFSYTGSDDYCDYFLDVGDFTASGQCDQNFSLHYWD